MRVAIVTGAAKPDSIGHAVALGLLGEGMQVVVADLYEQGFGTLPKCLCIRTDVSHPASVDAMVNRAMEKHGRTMCSSTASAAAGASPRKT